MRKNVAKVSIFDEVDWSEVDMSDAVGKLESKLATAAKAAVAVSKAAVIVSAKDAADDTAGAVQSAMKNARNEFLQGGSYKAATMSLRADYGNTADKTVKAVDRVRQVEEKIAGYVDKMSGSLALLHAL